jgi:hypothetical protein
MGQGIYNLVINNAAGISSGGSSYINSWDSLYLKSGVFTTSGSLYIHGGISTGSGTIQSGSNLVGFDGLGVAQKLPASSFASTTIARLRITNSLGVTISGPLTVSDTLYLDSGKLTTGGNLTISGGVQRTTGGIVNSGSDTVIFNGTVSQPLAANAFWSTDVTNLLIKNSAGITSTSGALTVTGSLGLTNLSRTIPITATGHTATITGIKLIIKGFSTAPTVNEVFTLITAGTLSGTFTSTSLPSGYTGTVSYTSTTVKLTINTIPMSAVNKVVTSDELAAPSFSMFPNPATNSVTLMHEKADETTSIIIYNINGKQLMTQKIEVGNTQTTVDLSKLAAGSYIVSYRSGNGTKTVSLIKK